MDLLAMRQHFARLACLLRPVAFVAPPVRSLVLLATALLLCLAATSSAAWQFLRLTETRYLSALSEPSQRSSPGFVQGLLPLASSAEGSRALVEACQEARASVVTLDVTDQAPTPASLGITHWTLAVRGSYPATKACLQGFLERAPEVRLTELRFELTGSDVVASASAQRLSAPQRAQDAR